MKLRRLLGTVFVVGLIAYGWKASGDLRPFVKIDPVGVQNCRVVQTEGLIGAEDMEFDHQTATLYIAASNRRKSGNFRPDKGAIFRWQPDKEPAPVPLDVQGNDDALRPHGIGLYRHPGGERRLFVVNHTSRGETVSIFRIETANGIEKLATIREVRAPQFVSINDVAPSGLESFYVTNDHGRPPVLGHMWEDFAMLSRGSLVYFDGTSAQTVVSGLRYANGVTLSADRKLLTVAETTAYRIKFFHHADDGKLQLVSERSIDTTPDNFSQDERGEFLIGAHPSPYQFIRYAASASDPSPSEVLSMHVTPDGSSQTFSTVLRAPGEVFGASSVAASHGPHLVVGGVFDRGVLYCAKPAS